MFLLEYILLAVYIFLIAKAFVPQPEPEETPEKKLEDALTKYILHLEKSANDKTE